LFPSSKKHGLKFDLNAFNSPIFFDLFQAVLSEDRTGMLMPMEYIGKLNTLPMNTDFGLK